MKFWQLRLAKDVDDDPFFITKITYEHEPAVVVEDEGGFSQAEAAVLKKHAPSQCPTAH